MKISIDASNIKAGGGLTHLKQLIENNYCNNTIDLIGGNWLEKIEARENVNKITLVKEFSSLIKQEFFKFNFLESYLSRGDIAFIPGGTFSSKKIPYVSMSQNMLVFEEKERNRFPRSFTWLRYLVLEKLQVRSFKNAKGIIYISDYAKNYIENKYPKLKEKKSKVIYHGISDNFRVEPKAQKKIKNYSIDKPFRLLYISIVNFYKHQWNVIEAVNRLKEEEFPIELDLVGPMYKPAKEKFSNSLKGTDDYVFYKGQIAYEKISDIYKKADLFIFASTCENMPNILVEAMSAGLPILSSNYGPMPEILKDAGEYMDPLSVESIYLSLKKLLQNPKRRGEIARKSYNYSRNFSWKKTSQQTFDFIAEVYKNEVEK